MLHSIVEEARSVTDMDNIKRWFTITHFVRPNFDFRWSRFPLSTMSTSQTTRTWTNCLSHPLCALVYDTCMSYAQNK